MTELNQQQRQAVERTGQDVCVVAGPGSGKTRVLTERFYWLVDERQIAPDRILTVTFTKKAASEIKARLVGTLRDRADLRQEVERAYVSTIHGFCTRLLRENSIAAGVDIGFTPLEDPESRRLRRESADWVLDELFTNSPDEARLLMESIAVSSRSSDNTTDLADTLIEVYEALRVAGDDWRNPRPAAHPAYALPEFLNDLEELLANTAEWHTSKQKEQLSELSEWLVRARAATGAAPADQLGLLASFSVNRQRVPRSLSPEFKILKEESAAEVRSQILQQYYAPQRALIIEVLRQLENEYRQRKQAQSALDFADLEEHTLNLLDTSPTVRDEIRQQFDYILMDELQDTNPLQWKIIDRIRRPDRFFGVGDINQSIYGFRHADPEGFRRYEQSLAASGATVDKLVTNYRTRQDILDVVMWAVRDEPGIVPPELESGSDFPERASPATELLVSTAADTATAAENEALWIAGRIRTIAAEEKISFDKIAVLGRKMKLLKPISDALRAIGIPSITTGGQGLYEARETVDLLLVCNALANVHDEMSLAGLLRSPFVGCHDETLLRLKILRPKSLWHGLAAAADQPPDAILEEEMEKLRWLHGIVNELRARPSAAPDSLLSRFLDESGYLTGRDAQGRANIERFLRRLREKFHSAGRPLAEVAEEIARTRADAPEAEAPPADAANAVQLMSIHASKGLEFPVVFIPGLQSGARYDLPPICRSGDHGIGVRWLDPVTRDNQGDPAYEAAKDELAAKLSEEEWRLLYVAMTRAETRLTLSWAAGEKSHRRGWARTLTERFRLAGEAEPQELVTDTASDARFSLVQLTEKPAVETASPEETPATFPEELPPPALNGQHDAAVAVTQVSAFLDCPRKYYLRSYLGFRPVDTARWDPEDPQADLSDDKTPTPDGAEIGRQVHDLLGGIAVDSPLEEALNLADAVRATPLSQRIEKAPRAAREYGLLFELEDVILRGQIDVWFEEGDRLVVADYKTDRFDPDEEPDRLRPYELQLRLYALALERLTGRLPSEAWLLFARSGKSVGVSLDPIALEAARGCLTALKRAQETNRFPLIEGSHCGVCDFYRQLCPAGRNVPATS